MKRLPHKGLTSPHTITVPITTHAAVEAASQATGISSSALYSLGGEIVAAVVGYTEECSQDLNLFDIGARLVNLTENKAAIRSALESLKIGANK